MIKGHKIERKIEIKEFIDIVKNFKENDINATNHTFFRLNEQQRKVFKDKLIKEIILNETPILAGIQHNQCYAVFYKYGNDSLRVILELQANKINIVTFYIVDNQQIPKV